MKQIKLTRGFYAIVDDEDYDWLNQWKWHVNESKGKRYAKRGIRDKNKMRFVSMHRLIINPTNEVDHINGDGLDNRRGNLRECTHKQNCANRVGYGSSKYLGVYWWKTRSRWKAQIKIDGKKTGLGTFIDEQQAALAYNKRAAQVFGEFAKLNKVA